MQERHLLRRRPLGEWSHAELIRFLGIGTDHEVLIPLALSRLRQEPEASSNAGSSGLLRAVLIQREYWRQAPASAITEIREIAEQTLSGIFEITDDYDRLCEEVMVYESLWRFERFLAEHPAEKNRNG